jgi:hypothetical protein
MRPMRFPWLIVLVLTACTPPPLGLRVATGDADRPEWSAADAAPLVVAGGWTLDGGAALREVRVENRGATPVELNTNALT